MMMSKQDSFNIKASEQLLNSICDALFANADRYLRIKDLFSDEEIKNFDDDFKRFNGEHGEEDT